MKHYEGRRDKDGTPRVYVVEDNTVGPLPPRLDLANKSPTGLNWGYAGSGPAQLALAIVADATGDDDRALRLYQAFKARFVQNLDAASPWQISRETVLLMLAAIERDGPRTRLQRSFGRKVDPLTPRR